MSISKYNNGYITINQKNFDIKIGLPFDSIVIFWLCYYAFLIYCFYVSIVILKNNKNPTKDYKDKKYTYKLINIIGLIFTGIYTFVTVVNVDIPELIVNTKKYITLNLPFVIGFFISVFMIIIQSITVSKTE